MGQESDGPDQLRSLKLGWWAYALVVFGVIVFVGFVYLPWVVFGLFVYYVARPIEARVAPRLPSKNLAAALTLALVVVPFVAILGGAVVVAVVELSAFLTGDFAAFVERFLPIAAALLPDDPAVLLGDLFAALGTGTAQTVFSSLTATIGSVGGTLFNVFLSLLFAFFLLREDDRLAAWFRTDIADEETDTHRYLAAVDEGLESVYFGYTVTIFVVMVLAAVVYTLFNLVAPPGVALPAPITLAVITGLFTVIPLVGRSIVYFVVAGYLSFVALRTNPTAIWFPLVWLAVMELPFDNTIRIYIRPKLSGRMLPMSLLVFAYLIGPPLFGWYGIFYGPFLLVVVVLFLQFKLPRLLHPERADEPFGPVKPTPEWDEDEDESRLGFGDTGTDVDEPTDPGPSD